VNLFHSSYPALLPSSELAHILVEMLRYNLVGCQLWLCAVSSINHHLLNFMFTPDGHKYLILSDSYMCLYVHVLQRSTFWWKWFSRKLWTDFSFSMSITLAFKFCKILWDKQKHVLIYARDKDVAKCANYHIIQLFITHLRLQPLAPLFSVISSMFLTSF